MKTSIVSLTTLLACAGAMAQADPAACARIADSSARLACYDNWALRNGTVQPAVKPTTPVDAAPSTNPVPSSATTLPPAPNPEAPAAVQTAAQRAATQPSEITRFWDLEHASARDSLEIRGYRPISLAVTSADNVNTQPSSPTNGSAASATGYSKTELKINLSVRTKIASGLLRRGDDALRDSIWFGYTQQSYWQLFNSGISRPFRATDHEPELIYVFPHTLPLPAGWTYRMSGVGLVHQSNGQSLPFSRSWNRAYLMAAADKIAASGDRFTLQARAWQRIDEKANKDDNPDISNFIGRAELAGYWSFDTGQAKEKTTHTLGLTVRHSLHREARGSARLEYLRSIGSVNSGLRFHTQLFSGYGDSLIDYNRKRTVLSVGLSLVDW
jgi:phospholipase A1/A2